MTVHIASERAALDILKSFVMIFQSDGSEYDQAALSAAREALKYLEKNKIPAGKHPALVVPTGLHGKNEVRVYTNSDGEMTIEIVEGWKDRIAIASPDSEELKKLTDFLTNYIKDNSSGEDSDY